MCIGRRGTGDETLIGVLDQETDDGQGDHVEQRNTPEYLLDGSWERLARVRCLGSSQTNQFSSSESKGSVDEGTAETLEAMVESTGIMPVFATDIASLGTATAVDNDAENARDDVSITSQIKTQSPVVYCVIVWSREHT